MNYALTPEQLALDSVAQWTWGKRGLAKKFALSFSEETVTESILLELAGNFPGQLTILSFSKFQEGKRGADWAWLFCDSSQNANFPMLVQAKVLDQEDKSYPEIKRRIGRSKIRQIDRLVDTAEKFGWPPLYVFYNHLTDTNRLPRSCLSMPTLIPKSWGISIADAYAVREALNDQTFDTHSRHSRPLKCLLCSGGQGIKPDGGSAALARSALEMLRHLSDADGFELKTVPNLYREPPKLFRDAIQISRVEDPTIRASLAAELGAQTAGVEGVVVLQDVGTSEADF